MSRILPEVANVVDLFNGKYRYQIPGYQRPFSWGSDHVSELLRDIEESTESDPLFLGTLIFHERGNDVCDVVDGQQRLTALSLLLIVLRSKLREWGQPMEEKRNMIFNLIRINTLYSSSNELRVKVSDSIAGIYKCISEYEWDGKIESLKTTSRRSEYKLVAPLLTAFDEYFSDKSRFASTSDVEAFIRKLSLSYFIKINVVTELQAFGVFERTNARGQDLAVSDLLKNYLFSEIKIEDIESKWQQIENCSCGNMVKMVRYFYDCRRTTGEPIRKSKLFPALKSMAKTNGVAPSRSTPQEQFLNSLCDFSDFYKRCVDGTSQDLSVWFDQFDERDFGDKGYMSGKISVEYMTKKRKMILGLRFLADQGVGMHIPLVYSGLSWCRAANDKKNFNALVYLVQVVEHFHFIHNTVCGLPNNKAEGIYHKYEARFNSAASSGDAEFSGLVDQLKSELSSLLSKPAFVANFATLSYTKSASKNLMLRYVFHKFTNRKVVGAGEMTWVYSDNPDFSIDHIYPQNPESGEKMADAALHSIGNLMPLSGELNKRFSNSMPAEKFVMIAPGGDFRSRVQNLNFVMELIREYESQSHIWNAAMVENRSAALAEIAWGEVWGFDLIKIN